jgi:hypothetical protein
MAAVTSKIRLATGICLVPKHNPVVLARVVATPDFISGGRFILGAGIGWLEEEFDAIGVPWEPRAHRTRGRTRSPPIAANSSIFVAFAAIDNKQELLLKNMFSLALSLIDPIERL